MRRNLMALGLVAMTGAALFAQPTVDLGLPYRLATQDKVVDDRIRDATARMSASGLTPKQVLDILQDIDAGAGLKQARTFPAKDDLQQALIALLEAESKRVQKVRGALEMEL